MRKLIGVEWWRLALLAALFTVFAVINPSFAQPAGISALVDGAVLTGLVALGLGITMLARELDLSAGSMAALAGVVAIHLIGYGLAPAILGGLAAGALVGVIQGFFIARLQINSLIFTVGTLIALRGLTFIASGENTIVMPFTLLDLSDWLSSSVGPLTVLSAFMIAAFVLVGLFMAFTRWGREIRAIGDGRDEARAAGVPLMRPMVTAFAISGMCAGLAGALLSIRSGSATPYGFEAVLLSGVTAALIGGVSLDGGRGSIVGIFVGVLTLRVLVAGMGSLGTPFYMQSIAVGVLLLVFLFLDLLPKRFGSLLSRRSSNP